LLDLLLVEDIRDLRHPSTALLAEELSLRWELFGVVEAAVGYVPARTLGRRRRKRKLSISRRKKK